MKPIGILGGGQLSRMLVLEAHRRGLPVAVLCASSLEPAVSVTANWVAGSPDNEADLVAFLKRCSAVTFESEFFIASLLERASQVTGTPVWPRPQTMDLIRDRLTQKQSFDAHKLPTSQWQSVSSAEDAFKAWESLGLPAKGLVLKARTGGYDGYGTFVVKSKKALSNFIKNELSRPGSPGYIGEAFVPFKRELAIIVARDQKGKVIIYPYVESKQKNSRCLWTLGPQKETEKMAKMRQEIGAFLKAIDYVGVMGVEFFDLGDKLLINEISPRVHNSGHYTLSAMPFNQFSAHLFSVAGLQLQKPASPYATFAMWNLLGTTSPRQKLTPWFAGTHSRNMESETWEVSWYGKQESRPGRKLGHISVASYLKGPSGLKSCLNLARKIAMKAEKEIGF
jgi:5-(carboxyamino)imidazole ribonucleotide synthase